MTKSMDYTLTGFDFCGVQDQPMIAISAESFKQIEDKAKRWDRLMDGLPEDFGPGFNGCIEWTDICKAILDATGEDTK